VKGKSPLLELSVLTFRVHSLLQLDIFGFESFEVNRFEQLCINYTNEKLQQKYTLDIFRSVQEEYAHEGIELGEITFDDNADVLRLIEGRVGIISVLNEECIRPNGNDMGFVSKVKSVNSESAFLVSEKLHKPTEFAIQHYAGVVTYDANNFVQKNTDALPTDVIECACLSSNELIKVELKAAADEKAKAGGEKSKRGASTLTVTTKFKHQLSKLMHDVTKTQTRYIRCIKPNPEKAPLKMNMGSSAEQLRCAGVVAAVTISRVAFPNRLMRETTLERFGCLGHVDLDEVMEEKKQETEVDESGYRDAVTRLLTSVLQELVTRKDDGSVTQAFEVGRSRVYFRTGALEFLEAKRLAALSVFATSIERITRGFTARSKFWKMKYAAIDSQANARRAIARKSFLRAKSACIIMECWVRCVFARRELARRQREAAAIRLQSRWRSVLAVAVLVKCKSAAVVIQKIARGSIQRPKYREALKEAQEEAKVNSKVAALQKRLQEAEMKWIQADKKRIEAEKRVEGIAAGTVPAPTTPQGNKPVIITDEEKYVPPTSPASSLQQQLLIDESNQMLEYFRKEVFKLKSANYLLREDLAAAKQEHKSLLALNEAMEASHSALKKNVNKMSTNNMRLSTNATKHKDEVGKLKQEMKMEKIKHASEVKSLQAEMKQKDREHDNEVTKLRREMEQMRRVIAKAPRSINKPPPEYERAHFELPSRNDRLRSRNAPAMSRTTSMADMSQTSTLSSNSEWDHDGYFDRNSHPENKGGSAEWTVVVSPKKKTKSKQRSRPPSSGKRHENPMNNPKYNGKKKSSPKPPIAPVSSLAAAAADGNAARRGSGDSKTPKGNKIKTNVKRSGSQSSLGKAAANKNENAVEKSPAQTSLGNATGTASRNVSDKTPKISNKKSALP
jgi:myosin heavy subunit